MEIRRKVEGGGEAVDRGRESMYYSSKPKTKCRIVEEGRGLPAGWRS